VVARAEVSAGEGVGGRQGGEEGGGGGVIESMFAKLRLFRVPEMLGAAFILALLALVFFYTLKG